MFPASRSPRRLATVIRPMAVTPIRTPDVVSRAGMTDWIWAMAAAVETATVMT